MFTLSLGGELASQPRASHGPFAADRCCRNAERGGRFRDAETGEVPKLDQPRLLRVDRGKSRESSIQREEVHAVRDAVRRDELAVEGIECDLDRAITTLLCAPCAGVIDEHATHHLGSDSKELCAALPAGLMLVVDPKPSLMDERRWLECAALAFVTQHTSSLSPKLLVNEARERLRCVFVSRSPSAQELGHVLMHSVGRSRNRHRRSELGKPRIESHLLMDSRTGEWVCRPFTRYEIGRAPHPFRLMEDRMLTPVIRVAVSLAALTSTLTIGACVRSASPVTASGTITTAERPLAIPFENEAQTYVDVYFVGELREWWLGRVVPGGLTTLQIPVAALLDNSGYVRLAVLAGVPRSAQAAHDPRAVLTIAQPPSALLAQRWTFHKTALASPEITGQPMRLR